MAGAFPLPFPLTNRLSSDEFVVVEDVEEDDGEGDGDAPFIPSFKWFRICNSYRYVH